MGSSGRMIGARIALVALPGLLGPGCSGGFTNLEQIPLIEPDPRASAATALLLDETRIEYSLDPGRGEPVVRVTTHQIIQVLRESESSRGHQSLSYDPNFTEVEAFRLQVRRPDGSVDRKQLSDASEQPRWSRLLYDSARLLTLDGGPAPPGSLIERFERLRHRDTRIHSHRFWFESNRPIRKARLVVSYPTGWKIDWAARRDDAPTEFPPRVRHTEQRTELTWTTEDVPALEDEPFAPPKGYFALQLLLRLIEWQVDTRSFRAPDSEVALSAWLFRFTRQEPTPDQALARQAATLIEGLGADARAKAAALFRWVRDEVDYCAIEIGYGGWIPSPASEVFRLGYGDCKDKANLLKQMLGSVGIPSTLVLILTQARYPARFHLARGVGSFDHAILRILLPDGSLLVDPTAASSPFGTLPSADEGAPILPLTEAGEPLGATPLSPPEANREFLLRRLPLEVEGEVQGTFRLKATGALARTLRGRLRGLPIGQRQTFVSGALPARVEDVSELHLTNTGIDDEGAVEIRGRFRGPQLVERAGNLRIVRASRLFLPLNRALPGSPRRLPVLCDRLRVRDQSVAFTLPSGARVEPLPEAAQIPTPCGPYRLAWRQEDGVLIAHRSFEVRARHIPASRSAKLREAYQKIVAAEQIAVVVEVRP